MTLAVNAHASVVQTFPVTTGAIEGTPFAAPSRTRQSGLAVVVSFDIDPGNNSYIIEGSLDGTNWVELDTLAGTDDTPLSLEVNPCTFPLIRVSQVTKTNGAIATVTAILV